MTQHVYARLAGHGLAIVPKTPFHFERLTTSDVPLRVGHGDATGVLSAYSQAAHELSTVADVEAGPMHEYWAIETSAFRSIWPIGYVVHYDPSGPPGFYLLSKNQAMIFAQGPFLSAKIPAPEHMVGPGQSLVAVGDTGSIAWADFTYLHEGQVWAQRHHIVSLATGKKIVVTFQAPQAVALRELEAGLGFITTIGVPQGAA